MAAGCGSRSDSMPVRENLEAIQAPGSASGTTTRAKQLVRHDCKLSAVYNVREATGSAFLIQSQTLHLRLLVPRKGTPYAIECLGPIVVELPGAASKLAAEAHDLHGGRESSLELRTPESIPLAPGRRVRPESGKQLVVIELPRRPGGGYDNFRVELAFRVPKAPLVRERVVYTASVTCGESSYLQPVVPLGTDLGFVNAFTPPAKGKALDLVLPHLAAGISSHGEETQSLPCEG
jgi:hypothetical protein